MRNFRTAVGRSEALSAVEGRSDIFPFNQSRTGTGYNAVVQAAYALEFANARNA